MLKKEKRISEKNNELISSVNDSFLMIKFQFLILQFFSFRLLKKNLLSGF